MVPGLGKTAHVAQAIGAPTVSTLGCPGHTLLAADLYDLARPGKSLAPGVNNRQARFQRRQGDRFVGIHLGRAAHVPFTPEAHRTDVQ